MNEQNNGQLSTLQRPATNDPGAWKAYWKELGQPWRTESEIDSERLKYLAERRNIMPNVKQGIYPFKDIEPKLTRADIEWLLATHEDGRGPVDWSDESQKERDGLDLRSADLRHLNLYRLPLTCLYGGLKLDEWREATEEQRNIATLHLQGTYLFEAQLQGAILREAQLQEAILSRAQLQKANLDRTQLQGAYLIGAQLQGAYLAEAQLQGAILREAQLQEAYLKEAQLQGAYLNAAHLQKADLREAHLQKADLRGVQLQGSKLQKLHLEGAELQGAYLEDAKLNNAILSNEEDGFALMADISWGNVNLAVVNWEPVKRLGDEQQAHQKQDSQGKPKEKETRITEYKDAVRANRQLAVVLRDQGLNEEADHFAYRAQLLQRIVWRMQGRPLKFLLSWFLYLLAGYGYRPLRSLIAYLIIIFSFMGLYLLNAHFVAPHLRWDEALVLSVSSFHGRGFFTQNVTLGDTYARLAAVEAIVGLFIEISFIATFTQRFFGR